MGYNAGVSQNNNSVAIGRNAAATSQGISSVAIGYNAGLVQETNSVAIGYNSGKDQGAQSIAIGYQAAQHAQGVSSIAIGHGTAQTQGQYSVSIGYQAGKNTTTNGNITIGKQAGYSNQGENAITIGKQAGYSNQGENAIAIGNQAGKTDQGENSIIINASSNALNSDQPNRFYVNPIRPEDSTSNPLIWPLGWNISTREITWTPNKPEWRQHYSWSTRLNPDLNSGGYTFSSPQTSGAGWRGEPQTIMPDEMDDGGTGYCMRLPRNGVISECSVVVPYSETSLNIDIKAFKPSITDMHADNKGAVTADRLYSNTGSIAHYVGSGSTPFRNGVTENEFVLLNNFQLGNGAFEAGTFIIFQIVPRFGSSNHAAGHQWYNFSMIIDYQ